MTDIPSQIAAMLERAESAEQQAIIEEELRPVTCSNSRTNQRHQRTYMDAPNPPAACPTCHTEIPNAPGAYWCYWRRGGMSALYRRKDGYWCDDRDFLDSGVIERVVWFYGPLPATIEEATALAALASYDAAKENA